MRMAASASDVVEAPGSSFPFSLEPIPDKLEGGCYIGPIFLTSLADLVSGRRSAGGGTTRGGGSSGDRKPTPKVGSMGGPAQLQARYEAHPPSQLLWDGENPRFIPAEAVFPTLKGHVICKNWHLFGVFWEDYKRKHSHVPIPPEVETTNVGLLKVARGEWQGYLQPIYGRPTPTPPPPTPMPLWD